MSKQKHAHKLVYETARKLAHELYDTLMQDQVYYTEWKRQNPDLGAKALEARFVVKNTHRCLETARATLAVMLRGPIDSPLKQDIYEALCLDAALVRGRAQVPSGPILQHQNRN
jgi:hypothetical protein